MTESTPKPTPKPLDTARTIVVADDEKDIAEVVQFNLEEHGYTVFLAHDGESAIEEVHTRKPQLLILDIGMPRMNGYQVCEQLKHAPETRKLPIIFLTGLDGEKDAIHGLTLGAEDYIRKPFGAGELLARVDAVFRRLGIDGAPKHADVVALGPIHIDIASERVTVLGKSVRLAPLEYQLLRVLAHSPGENFSREQLRQILETRRSEEYIDELVESLRRKLRRYGKHIVTVRGIGYRSEV